MTLSANVYENESDSAALQRALGWLQERWELAGVTHVAGSLGALVATDNANGRVTRIYSWSCSTSYIWRGMRVTGAVRGAAHVYAVGGNLSEVKKARKEALERDRTSILTDRARREARNEAEFAVLLKRYLGGETTYPLILSPAGSTRTPRVDRRASDTWPFVVGDVTPPVLLSGDIDSTGTSAWLKYDERLDANSLPAASTYALTGTSAMVTAVDIPAYIASDNREYRRHVRLTLSPPVQSGETVALSYALPSSGKIRDAAGNNTAAFAAYALTNGSLA